MIRRTTIEVTWDDHGRNDEPEWGYHLRMGDIDADEVRVLVDVSYGHDGDCSPNHGAKRNEVD